MKKCIALILVLMLCFALCACGESADTQPSQSESDMPHEHSYTSIVTPPTCTEKGYTTYTCACGKSYTADQVDIADHDYQETARVDATVEDDGSVTHTCSFCGDSYCDILYATGSIGLSYELNADGSYTVVGLGTCTDSHVVIPQYYKDAKVTAIGRRAFYDCATITEITIPDTITEIGQQVFYKSSSLHTVYNNSTYYNAENKFLNVTNIKKIVFGGTYIPDGFCYNLTNIEEVVILDGVTSIGMNAFYGCSNLASIEISKSVTTIWDQAFGGCDKLSSVYITDISAWCEIETSLFTNGANPLVCGATLYLNGEEITELVIPEGVSKIGNYAFYGCDKLERIEIPNTVTSIGSYAFCNCTNLKSAIFPDSIITINGGTFSCCSSLENIVIPDTVASIGYYAFYGCSSLTNLVIPDSVGTIDYYAFSDCVGLESITIPDSITSIGEAVLAGCSNLAQLHFSGTTDQWNSIAKGSDWNLGIGNYTIYCIDGEISK